MLSFFKTALGRYNWYTKNCRYLRCKIWWVLTYLYTYETITRVKKLNTCIISQSSFMPLCSPFPWDTLSPFHLQVPTGMLSASTDYFTFSRVSYERNHIICILFFAWIFLLSIIILRFIQAIASCLSIVSLSSISLCGHTNIFTSWQIFGLLIPGISSLFNIIHSSWCEMVSHYSLYSPDD